MCDDTARRVQAALQRLAKAPEPTTAEERRKALALRNALLRRQRGGR